MIFKEAISKAMLKLSEDDKVVFLGEGLVDKTPIYGTMTDVPKGKVIEFPIAENLIVGCAIGLALEGYIPIVVFQRIDFMMCAADAIINHLALLPRISNGLVKLPVILRTVIGAQDTQKFNVGLQHSKDLTNVFKDYINTCTLSPALGGIYTTYRNYIESDSPAIIIERKDDYEKECLNG